MLDSHTKDTSCPTCGKRLDGVFDPDGENVPRPGDLGICIYCNGIHVFTETMDFRLPTEDELVKMPLDILSRYQRAIVAARNA